MAEHRVEITDSTGRTMKILVRLLAHGKATWKTLISGHFSIEGGIADTGYYPSGRVAWLALYGGNAVDDDKLVLHLDDFLNFTGPAREGTGLIYPRDHLAMKLGEVKWRLLIPGD